MTISPRLLELLRVSSKVSKTVYIGANSNVLRVRNAKNNLQFHAPFQDTIPNDVALYDTRDIINAVITASSYPTVLFGQNATSVTYDRSSTLTIPYADKNLIPVPASNLPVDSSSLLASFLITADMRKSMVKMAKIGMKTLKTPTKKIQAIRDPYWWFYTDGSTSEVNVWSAFSAAYTSKGKVPLLFNSKRSDWHIGFSTRAIFSLPAYGDYQIDVHYFNTKRGFLHGLAVMKDDENEYVWLAPLASQADPDLTDKKLATKKWLKTHHLGGNETADAFQVEVMNKPVIWQST